MVTTRFYLDCRAVHDGQPAPLRLVITRNRTRAYIPLSVSLLPAQWDARRQIVVEHPRRVALNHFIQSQKVAVDDIIFRISGHGELTGLTAAGIKDRVLGELHPEEEEETVTSPHTSFLDFTAKKSGRTKQIYEATLSRILAYCPRFPALTWEDINIKWLEDFDTFLSETSPSRNARNIHFRNIRAVFNHAIDEELTQCYPFRKFKLRPEPTRKRSMSVEAMRKVIASPLDEWQTPYRDMFVLSFCLIGINIVDLCSLTEIADGRVEYVRAKTHRPYSIKVEPEALALIEKYRGEKQLLYMLDGHKTYRTWYGQLCKALRSIRDKLNKVNDGIRIRELTSYWARHTWATVAASLDIPKETIAAALGHGGNTVTDIYIDFDRKKVDAANRRVLDWVFYKKL